MEVAAIGGAIVALIFGAAIGSLIGGAILRAAGDED